MDNKTCITCEVEKSHEEFYDHPATADRKSTKCKDCEREYQKARRKKKKEEDPEGAKEYTKRKGREFKQRKLQEYLDKTDNSDQNQN